MRPEVTAVVTTHGGRASVHEAIASVCAETHDDLEIVVVDDGGQFTPTADVPVRVVRGTRLGVGRARNLGLAAARGEFVIFLDDDDAAMPHRIATLLATARRNGASFCFGMTRRVARDTTEVLESVPTHQIEAGAVQFCDLLTCAPHINSVLVRTDVLRAAGGLDADAHHFDEWSAWLRIANRGVAMWSVAETVAEWRIHSQGLSSDVLLQQAMKARLLSLFQRLQTCLSPENARAVSVARSIVLSADIITYDDYADVMATVRGQLHRMGTCFGDQRSCRGVA
jgi:hypothetical protein